MDLSLVLPQSYMNEAFNIFSNFHYLCQDTEGEQNTTLQNTEGEQNKTLLASYCSGHLATVQD